MTRVMPCSHGGRAGCQARRQSGQLHSVSEHEIAFDRDSSHMGGSSSPPSPSLGPSFAPLGWFLLQISQRTSPLQQGVGRTAATLLLAMQRWWERQGNGRLQKNLSKVNE